MVPLIARLVDAGLVARERADGRSHALSLTSRGVNKVAAINRILDRQEAQFQSSLDARSMAVLRKALATLRGTGEGSDRDS
jgi:DNA-binding MarR family transcriptional regulator